MEALTPLGNQVNQNAGFDSYSKILGMQKAQLDLQSARQTLQTQQYQQQSAQANAIQDQRKAQEMQTAAILLQDPVGNGLTDKEGNPTANASSIIQQNLPITGTEHFKNLMAAAGAKVQLAQGKLNLGADQQKTVFGRIAGLATTPNTKSTDVIDALDDLEKQYAGTPNEKGINLVASSIRTAIGQHSREHPDDTNGMSNDVRTLLTSMASTGQSGAEVAARNTGTTGTVDTGATIQPVNMPSQAFGGGMTLAGVPITKSLAPAQTPGVAAATAAAIGSAKSDIDRKNEISTSVVPSTNALSTISEMRGYLDQLKQGSFSQAVIKAQAAAGDKSPEITARALYVKDMEKLKALSGSAATTDAQRNTVTGSFPDLQNPDIETNHVALDSIEGTMRQNISRSRSALAYLQKHPDAGGLQSSDDRLMANSDPLLHTYSSLKTPAEKTQFLTRHFKNKEEITNFIHRKRDFDHSSSASE